MGKPKHIVSTLTNINEKHIPHRYSRCIYSIGSKLVSTYQSWYEHSSWWGHEISHSYGQSWQQHHPDEAHEKPKFKEMQRAYLKLLERIISYSGRHCAKKYVLDNGYSETLKNSYTRLASWSWSPRTATTNLQRWQLKIQRTQSLQGWTATSFYFSGISYSHRQSSLLCHSWQVSCLFLLHFMSFLTNFLLIFARF